MIYRLYCGGMSPVKKISRQMRENLARATGADTGGFFFSVGQAHYWSDHREPTMVVFDKTKMPVPTPPKPYFVGTRINSAHIEKLRDISASVMFVVEGEARAKKKFVEYINNDFEYMGEDTRITENDIELDKNAEGLMVWVYDSDALHDTYQLFVYTDRYLRMV